MDELEHEISYLTNLKQFAESGQARWLDNNQLWVQQYPFDSWSHPFFSDTTIDVERASKLKASFDNKVKGTKAFADYEHGLDKAKGNKAAGEIKELKVVETPRAGFPTAGLWARVQFTDNARKEIEDGEWNYSSASHYDTWTHPQTGQTHEYVYDGMGLTNKPYVKDMAPLNFSEVGLTEEDIKQHAVLSAEQRKSLPDGAYMYKAPDGTRMFPFKHSDGSLDEVHLQKIIQLAPRANVPAEVKARVISRAKRLLGAKSHSEEEMAEIADAPLEAEDAHIEVEETPKVEAEVTPIENNEGGDKDVELEKQLREKLGLAEDADIIKAVTDLNDEVQPIREAMKSHSERKAFSEMFPDEAKRMVELEAREQDRQAKAFSDSFANTRLTKQVGEKEEATTLGFSGLVLQHVEGLAKKFSEGTVDITDVKELMDSVAKNGIVDYGTTGSSREDEKKLFNEDEPSGGNMHQVRKQFADKVSEIATEEEISFVEALPIAAAKFPKLADAYHGAGMAVEA